MADLNDPSASFTRAVLGVLSRATEVAAQARSNEVGSLHLLFVSLVGPKIDFEQLDQLRHHPPDEPTLLWAALSDAESNPISLARAVGRAVIDSARTEQLVSSRPSSNFRETFKARTRWTLRSKSRTVDSKETYTSVGSDSSPTPNDSFLETIRRARERKQQLADIFIGTYHLLCGLLDDTAVKEVLDSEHVNLDTLRAALEERNTPSQGVVETGAHTPLASFQELPSLSKHGIDLIKMAREGQLMPTIGRDGGIREVVRALCRRTRDSVLLIGDAGDSNISIYKLDLEELFVGTPKMQYELRMKNIINDIKRSQDAHNLIVLFLKELRPILTGKTSSGTKSWTGAATLLRREIADSHIQCISTCTPAAYREYTDKDDTLLLKFTTVTVEEPSLVETTAILRGIQQQHERHHDVIISDEAISVAARLAQQYLATQALPASAIRLMDEACAFTRIDRGMRPASVAAIEQELMSLSMRLQTLQRELWEVPTSSLETAKATQRELESRRKDLIRQQDMINEWWRNISTHRRLIVANERELASAQEDLTPDSNRINELRRQIKTLHEALDKLDKAGPKPVGSIECRGRDSHLFNLSDPDLVTPESIAKVVERSVNLPVQYLLATTGAQLSNLADSLGKHVFGQPEAIKTVVETIQISYNGLGMSERPVASFLFIGPSGSGKRLLARTLAYEVFGHQNSVITLNGNDFAQSQSLPRLSQIFAGHGPSTAQTNYTRRLPRCVVIVEGVENACTEFLSLLRGVLEEGHLSDGQRRLVDFRRCVIIMTSNIRPSSQGKSNSLLTSQDAMMNLFKGSRISTEFLDEVDEVVPFNTTSPQAARKIIEKSFDDLKQREAFKGMRLELDETAKTWLISTGISAGQGSRSVTTVFRNEVLKPLSRSFMDGSIQPHHLVRLRVNDGLSGLLLKVEHLSNGSSP